MAQADDSMNQKVSRKQNEGIEILRGLLRSLQGGRTLLEESQSSD
jgi:hypothetical protein